MTEAEAGQLVWMVTSAGPYDEGYNVEGLFADEASAQILVDKINASDPDFEATCERWELNQRENDFLMYRAAYAQNPGSSRDVKPTLRALHPLLPQDQKLWESIAFQRADSKQVQGVGYGRSQAEAEANLWQAIEKFKPEAAGI